MPYYNLTLFSFSTILTMDISNIEGHGYEFGVIFKLSDECDM